MTGMLVCAAAMMLFPSFVFGQTRVATPTFSIDGGEYSTVVMVVVRVSAPGATIHFTQNGLDPTQSDPVIVSGSTIAVNTTMILKARAFVHGRPPSNVRTAAFTIVAAESGSRIGPGAVDAGGRRSLLATPDGRVFEWAADEPPHRVTGLAGIVSVAVGPSHALALTDDRRVFAWGRNDFGQLGDGTTTTRRQPTAITGLNDVLQIAAGRKHSLALTSDGRVWAWGANDRGQLGVESPAHSSRPLLIDALADIAWIDAGNQHSIAVSRSGDVLTWGANRRGQLGDGSRIDRSTPIRLPLENVIQVAAGASHSLAVDGEGHVYSWGSGAYGELGTGSLAVATVPVMIDGLRAYAIRAGRRFSAAIDRENGLVMWGANQNGQLGDGTLVNRPRPVRGPSIDDISALALGGRHAVAATSSGDVWTWGRDEPPAERLTDVGDWGPPLAPDLDTTPPSITAHTPPANDADWHVAPVTVTFLCADNSAIVSCPPPVTVQEDGRATMVSGTAEDAAGNSATATVVVNIDRSPPLIALTGAPAGFTTARSSATLGGHAADATSGLTGQILCNGEPSAIVDGSFECHVGLQLGVNQIVLHATDVAGNVAALEVMVTRVEGTTAFTIAPDSRTMLVGEVAGMSLRDSLGAPVTGASWSSTDEGVVRLSDDNPPRLTAVAQGMATVLATKDGVAAEATVTVMAGQELPSGTSRWRIAPAPGFTMQSAIFTHRVDPSVPDIFLVESGMSGTTTLRGVTADGDVLWQQQSPGVPIMADSFGGLIVSEISAPAAGDTVHALAKLGDFGGVAPWRYEGAGPLGRPAQASDGTLYVMESVPVEGPHGDRVWDLHAVIIDGRTGTLIARHPLPKEVVDFTAITEDGASLCARDHRETGPDTVGPAVGGDGRGYILIRRSHQSIVDFCTGPTRTQRVDHRGVDLVVLSPDGAFELAPMHDETCSQPSPEQPACEPLGLTQVSPDGIGGALAVWNRAQSTPDGSTAQTVITRRSSDGAVSERSFDASTTIDRVGQDGIVFISGISEYGAVDVTSWTSKWSKPHDGAIIVAARPDGGAATTFDGMLQTIDADGQPTADPPVPMPLVRPTQELSGWFGIQDGSLHAVAGHFPDATRFVTRGGNGQFQLAVRNPGVGIFLKSHWAFEGVGLYKHFSLRIVPSNQAFWRSFDASGFFPRDVFGNHFMTLGAGTGPDDTSIACSGTLTKGKNRDRDVLEQPSSLDQYPVGSNENDYIRLLLAAYDAFGNDLPYACFPESNPGYFNSNSFARGLQDAVGLPSRQLRPGLIAPGWLTPVPPHFFQPH